MYEHRITFEDKRFGTLVGFVNLDSEVMPIRGKLNVYVPLLRKFVTCDLSTVVDSLVTSDID